MRRRVGSGINLYVISVTAHQNVGRRHFPARKLIRFGVQVSMQMQWHRLELDTGELVRIRTEPQDGKPFSWIERDLENLIALNPNLMGVEDQLPLRLGGRRGTVTSPDQAYVDELGRITVLEAKKIRAGLPVLAQVIAYADHWRLLPPGEISGDMRDRATQEGRTRELGRALLEVQAWAGSVLEQAPTDSALQSSGKRILRRLSNTWPEHPLQIGSREMLPMVGAPARIVAVARSFTDECLDFADLLSQRMVSVELIEIEIARRRGEVYVGKKIVHCDENCEPTWNLLRRVWRGYPEIRERFCLNGWADALNRTSFSFSHRENPEARFWFCASANDTTIWTVVPDGWHKNNPADRRALRARFIRELDPDDPSERWLEWEFSSSERKAVENCIAKVAGAVDSILAPERPRM
jgi:hypothetical protein